MYLKSDMDRFLRLKIISLKAEHCRHQENMLNVRRSLKTSESNPKYGETGMKFSNKSLASQQSLVAVSNRKSSYMAEKTMPITAADIRRS